VKSYYQIPSLEYLDSFLRRGGDAAFNSAFREGWKVLEQEPMDLLEVVLIKDDKTLKLLGKYSIY